MSKIITLIMIAMISISCSTYHTGHVPEAVAAMTNDCGNFVALERYYVEQTKLPKGFQSQEEYDATISFYKKALWDLRYNCQS